MKTQQAEIAAVMKIFGTNWNGVITRKQFSQMFAGELQAPPLPRPLAWRAPDLKGRGRTASRPSARWQGIASTISR